MRRTFLFGTVFAAAMAVGVGAQSGSATQDRSADHQSSREQNVTVTGCLQSADAWSGSSTGATGAATGSTAGSATGTTAGSTAGTTSSGSYGSSTATNPAGARFVLTNVSMNGRTGDTTSGSPTTTSGSQMSGQPGATGTTGSFNGVNTALWLMAASTTDDWSKYLNQRVEVKGMLMNNNPAASPYGSGGSATTTAPGSTTTSGATAGGSPTGSASGAPGSMYGSQNQASMGTLHVTSIKEVSGTCPSR